MSCPRGQEEDPELDFLSSQFNPRKALSLDVARHLPCPEVQPCDNLEHYVSIVKGRSLKKDSTQQSSVVTGKDKQEEKERNNEEMKEVVKEEDKEEEKEKKDEVEGIRSLEGAHKTKTVLSFMKDIKDGPIHLLQDCHIRESYVEVWIRHSRGLRGVCRGKLVAFDRHLNLILSDVEERYTPLRTVSNRGKKRKKKKKKQKITQQETPTDTVDPEDDHSIEVIHTSVEETTQQHDSSHEDDSNTIVPHNEVLPTQRREWERTQHVNQMFIRGDNVILIRPV